MATPKQRAAAAAVLATIIAVPAEGIRQIAYYDPPGILTVCYGHTGADVVAKRLYSMDECRALLTADMQKAVATVERCVPGLPVPVLAAFADAVFNLGPTLVCSRASSTAARMLYAGDLVGACNQLPRWDKARVLGAMVALPGLTKRRAAERSLCLTGTT
ncbi:UNVERIFIED_ORG: GH24 family phage-related lysozyme (muramidase) [Zoogloea ramigera]|uniref:Lysozyme n=1 Tax=Duganella zoogloeoides TaxID=75659 RepID=A0ABZ0Y5A8_9BURK|nr:lysozyme [Duganella zoogloeoides]WQH06903.1 lysozyme [Duganella zoogloeoides]